MNTAAAQLYESDFYGWLQHQADTLRIGNFASLDVDNLIEEIDSMGRSHRRALESRLELLLMHLLKWTFQPEMKSPSWRATIEVQRNQIGKLIRDNPSLKSRIPGVFEDSYKFATRLAKTETGLPAATFPSQCPWTFEQTTDQDFWPEPVLINSN